MSLRLEGQLLAMNQTEVEYSKDSSTKRQQIWDGNPESIKHLDLGSRILRTDLDLSKVEQKCQRNQTF